MKQFALLMVLFTISFNLLAQSSPSEAQVPQDPKAKAILDALTKKNKAYTTITADFTYKQENKDANINESQKGSVKLKGSKYILKIAGQEIYCNGTKKFTFIPDAEEVQISNIEKGDKDELNPSNLFTLYETGFKYKYEKEETTNGKTVDVIKLFPINPTKKNFHTAIIAVDKATNQIYYIKVLGKDGTNYTYFLDKITGNLPMEDSIFNFDVKKASEVIDLTE